MCRKFCEQETKLLYDDRVQIGECRSIVQDKYCDRKGGNGHAVALFWSYKTGNWVRSSPTIGDIDSNGELEVVFASSNSNIYALNSNGILLWSYEVTYYALPQYSTPALADIDSDGKLEIIVESDDGNLYAIDGNGALLWCSKLSYTIEVKSSPAVGDVDSDGKLEVVIGGGDYIYILDGGNGELEWCYKTGGNVHSSPAIGDIDSDGELEIVFASDDHRIYVIKTGGKVPADDLLPWPKFHRDRQNTGLYSGSAPKWSPHASFYPLSFLHKEVPKYGG
jgi:outer membrane protein assembly factor BamB